MKLNAYALILSCSFLVITTWSMFTPPKIKPNQLRVPVDYSPLKRSVKKGVFMALAGSGVLALIKKMPR